MKIGLYFAKQEEIVCYQESGFNHTWLSVNPNCQKVGIMRKPSRKELRTWEVCKKAFEIYNQSSFVFYNDSKGYYVADTDGLKPNYIGETLEDVETYLLSFEITDEDLF